MRRAVDDDKPLPDDEIPVEHRDSIRIAHKCVKTALAFHREGLEHIKRAADLLGDVCDGMPDSGDTGDGGDEGGQRPTGDGGDERGYSAQIARARAIRRRFGLV
jgi:hypothetical protein